MPGHSLEGLDITTQIWAVFGILVAAAVLFGWGRIRSDAIGVMVMLVLMASGLLSVSDALAGFSDPVVIVIISMFIVSQALVETGLAQTIGDLVLRASAGKEARLVTLLMLAIGSVGAFMSSTAAVAVFIPIALSVSDKAGMNRRRLLMPLGVAGMISGMMTLVATAPNLVVNQALQSRDLTPLDFFSFTPIGIAVLATAIVFMLVIGRGLLSRDSKGSQGSQASSARDLTASYGLEGRHRLRVSGSSPLIGQALSATRIRKTYGFNLIAIQKTVRNKSVFVPADAESVIEAGDMLILLGEGRKVDELAAQKRLVEVPGISAREYQALVREVGVAEVMLTPDSKFVGQTLISTHFRSTYDLTVLAVRRRGQALTSDLGDLPLDFGDVLLAVGSWERVLELGEERQHFVLLTLPAEHLDIRPARKHAPRALIILGAMVAAMALELAPTVLIALLAAAALVASKCVRLQMVYRVIGWQSVVLVATILPLATALQTSGAASLVSVSLIEALGNYGPIAMLTAIFLLTALAGLFISNTATAVLIAPIAIDAALNLGVSPQAFAMVVAIASSAAFVTPVSSPGNMLIQEPGGYRFIDFVKVGLPVQMLALVVAIAIIWFRYL